MRLLLQALVSAMCLDLQRCEWTRIHPITTLNQLVVLDFSRLTRDITEGYLACALHCLITSFNYCVTLNRGQCALRFTLWVAHLVKTAVKLKEYSKKKQLNKTDSCKDY